MKKTMTLLFVMFSLLLLAACGNDEKAADELVKYYNEEWISIQETKQEKMNEASSKLIDIAAADDGSGNQDETIAALVKEDMIPVLDDILDQLEAIDLEHKDLIKLNDLQIEAEEFAKQHTANIIKNYQGELSDSKYEIEENELKEKYDDVLEYRNELMEKYEVEFDTDKDEVAGFEPLKRKDE